MINLPILKSLDVDGYGLYPGDDAKAPGLHVNFQPGLTVILGTNGLGKTTLVTMLYRMLTGPFDIPIMMRAGQIGTARLGISPIRGNNRRTFAQRVGDGAMHASARLKFKLGDETVTVERNLRNLELQSFEISSSNSPKNEQHFQQEIVKLANVPEFSDWILLLRYIVFYFEDRRSLVWDPSAQRQLLRILFLDTAQSRGWTEREREILEADTSVRNLRAVVYGQEFQLAQDESLVAHGQSVKGKLEELDLRQREAQKALQNVSVVLPDVEDQHERSRQSFLKLEQDRDSQYRQLEKEQLHAIASQLPEFSESAQYILTQLITSGTCHVCGNDAPDFAESMRTRIRLAKCVLCESILMPTDYQDPSDSSDIDIQQSQSTLESIIVELEVARANLVQAEQDRISAVHEVQRLNADIAERAANINNLLSQLPPEESQMYEQRQELTLLRARAEVLQSELNAKRAAFNEIISSINLTVKRHATTVQKEFEDYAHEFLLEGCRLFWSPQSARLGQAGQRFDFPAFELELGGSDFVGTVRRSGPDDVSESQREFIDLSFRMALAKAGTLNQNTSLVMDAPESSLDAVFVGRASRVLGKFAQQEVENRLIITSNLGLGDFVPDLLKQCADAEDRRKRVVDLLAVAAPTSAVRSLRGEYDDARNSLLERAGILN